jgi:hypothetical protein
MWIRSLSAYSRLVLGLWSLLFLGVLLFNVLQYAAYPNDWTSLLTRFLLPALGAGGFLYGLRLSLDARLVIANSLLAIMAALYVGEFTLARRLDAQRQVAARSAGTQIDPRDKLTVIRDLRVHGVRAYPVTRAANLLEANATGQVQPILSAAGRPLLPMASIPRTTVVGCNELGSGSPTKPTGTDSTIPIGNGIRRVRRSEWSEIPSRMAIASRPIGTWPPSCGGASARRSTWASAVSALCWNWQR